MTDKGELMKENEEEKKDDLTKEQLEEQDYKSKEEEGFEKKVEGPKDTSVETQEAGPTTDVEHQQQQPGDIDKESKSLEVEEPLPNKEEDLDERKNTVEEAVPTTQVEHPEKEEDSKPTEETSVELSLPAQYDYESLYSKPTVTNMHQDTLQLIHSFGYECQKRSNIVTLDTNTLLYAAGNIIVLLDINTNEHKYMRTLGGGGVGAITVHPGHGYFAVGEKGNNPVIAIYFYPSLYLYRILKGGTEQQYSHMDFSPKEGTLLASVGGFPDYMLTVWDWEKESVVLRSKAFSQEIYRVSFSPDLPGHLTTSGTGHIRFWKMATTFTGLKLQGYLGKFGRTELSDIAAYVELPDGKVLSGTEWGNMLLWDGGFIKVELAKKGKKFCHNGAIDALYLDEGELISAGVDGFVRIWDFEIIDNADITEDNSVFEMEPLTEIKVGSDVSIKSLSRSTDPETPTIWYGQDAKGAIWKLDIVVSHTRKAPEKLVSYHSGEVKSVSCSPNSNTAASIAEDGSVRVYDLESLHTLCHIKYNSGGSSLIWAPLSIDPIAQTLLTGFSDGVLRVLKINKDSKLVKGGTPSGRITITQVCKPHTQAITTIAVDNEGSILATGSDDSTVFFLDIKKDYSPIGFVKVPSPVTCMTWSQPNQGPLKLLVCCHDGSMLEISAPIETYDTAHSYHLGSLTIASRKFVSIKDRLRREEVEAIKLAEKERKRKEKEAEREAEKEKRRQELGDDYHSDEEEDEMIEEEDEEEEKEEEDEVDKKEKPAGPSPIHDMFYENGDPNKFWVSMGGYDAGYMYNCSLEGATNSNDNYESSLSIPVPAFNGIDIPLHCMKFSQSGDYLLTGAENGCVRIHHLYSPYSLSSLDRYWSLSMHDSQYGYITSLSLSHNNKYVITGGADGNVFVYKANLPATTNTNRSAKLSKQIRITSESHSGSVRDIEDTTHYSLEDAKQKAEHDRKMKAAEAKKQQVRRQISKLRRNFTQLQQKSSSLPGHLRLSQSEFIMDPSMSKQLHQQLMEKIELVRKEMAWESEKHSIALDKLQKRYKDCVECERIVVWAINKTQSVSSIRAPSPSHKFLELLEAVQSSEDSTTPWTATSENTHEGRRKTRILKDLEEEIKESENEDDERRGLTKSETRRLKKERRKKEWEELYRIKPGENYEDPEEILAIEKAKREMGDYKLKTSSDYVVSKDQRVSTEKKRKQLILCRNTIFETKRTFNKKLLALRDEKLQIIDKITELAKQLKNIQTKLSPTLHKAIPSIPVIKPDEVPERELVYTKKSLLKFKKELKAREKAEKQAQAGAGEGFGGFGGFGGEQDEKGDDDETASSSGPSTSSIEETDTIQSIHRESSLSELELLMVDEQEIELLYQQDTILNKIEELVKQFDDKILYLHHEKSITEINIKSTDIKHLTLFEELELLKEFEKRESNFTGKYRSKKQERAQMESKIEEVEWTVQEKEKLVSKLQEQEKTLDFTFVESLGENNKFKEFLVKVYRKKIKRARLNTQQDKGEGEDDEDEEEESDSDESSSSEDESDEEGFDDSVCPPGCDPALFDQAVKMREQRLDVEEVLTEEKKHLDGVRRELDGLLKKAKTMEVHVKSALQDLQAFQLKKQQRLNELDANVVLKLHQILHYMSSGEPPYNVAQCLVFPASARIHLSKRIGELVHEKQQEKKRYKELRQRHVHLIRERKEMEHKVSELNDKANEIMRLKFGRIVNIDALEGLTTNKMIGELEENLRQEERKHDIKMYMLEKEINDIRQELLHDVRHNTDKLDRLHELTNRSRQLEEGLNARQKTMGTDVSSYYVFEPEEKERLLQIVEIQNQEIQALRDEIKVLSHKGGQLLPPSQPPGVMTESP